LGRTSFGGAAEPRYDLRPYGFGKRRFALLALLTLIALSGRRSCGVVITKFSGHAVTLRSSATLFADTLTSRSTSTCILAGNPPRATCSAAMLLGLYRIWGSEWATGCCAATSSTRVGPFLAFSVCKCVVRTDPSRVFCCRCRLLRKLIDPIAGSCGPAKKISTSRGNKSLKAEFLQSVPAAGPDLQPRRMLAARGPLPLRCAPGGPGGGQTIEGEAWVRNLDFGLFALGVF
jgi:hypothetical protein